jgi:hypothetical protein
VSLTRERRQDEGDLLVLAVDDRLDVREETRRDVRGLGRWPVGRREWIANRQPADGGGLAQLGPSSTTGIPIHLALRYTTRDPL